MTRFEINLTLLTTVTIVAQDATAAAKEARDLPDLFHVSTATLDGWNSIRREQGQPLTVDILPVYLEAEELEVVECARWVVQPQKDLNAGLSPDSGTRIEPCEEARATSWGVFEVDAAGCSNSVLVEDYPTRAAAQSAVDALNMGDPLPTPVWPVVMKKYLIEGSCDGALFSESVEAISLDDAKAFAVQRLCEAWGQEFGPDTTLDDLGDSACVSEYGPEDYARDAAADMLSLIDQISRMQTTGEADGADLGNDDAMDGLIRRARTLAAAARGQG